MRAIGVTILEALVVLVIGLGLGLGMNAVRGRNSIDLRRDYGPKILPTTTTSSSGPTTTNSSGPTASSATTNSATRSSSQPNPGTLPASPFQMIDFDEVVELYEDPKTQAGLYVFVDARNDEAFEKGHLRGAVQCDYYRLGDYIGHVLERVNGVEKVIVYCNGGNCEDSLSVCGVLTDYGVPAASILLYKGGWEEWHAKGMESVAGRE